MNKNKTNSKALVRKLTIPTEGPPLVGQASANFSILFIIEFLNRKAKN
jgi:hypothetical protein